MKLASADTLRARADAYLNLTGAYFNLNDLMDGRIYALKGKACLKKAKYLISCADGLDNLKKVADAFEKEHGPNAKLMKMS